MGFRELGTTLEEAARCVAGDIQVLHDRVPARFSLVARNALHAIFPHDHRAHSHQTGTQSDDAQSIPPLEMRVNVCWKSLSESGPVQLRLYPSKVRSKEG